MKEIPYEDIEEKATQLLNRFGPLKLTYEEVKKFAGVGVNDAILIRGLMRTRAQKLVRETCA